MHEIILGALKGRRTQVIDILLAKGIRIDIKNQKGRTVLHTLASISDDVEAIQMLITYGAKVDAQDLERRTPIHWASNVGHANVVEMLLENGANIEASNTLGNTPLLEALYKCKSISCHGTKLGGDIVEVVKTLIERCAYIKVKNYFGDTPLTLAIMSKNQQLIDLVKDKKTSSHCCSSASRTTNVFSDFVGYISHTFQGLYHHKIMPNTIEDHHVYDRHDRMDSNLSYPKRANDTLFLVDYLCRLLHKGYGKQINSTFLNGTTPAQAPLDALACDVYAALDECKKKYAYK